MASYLITGASRGLGLSIVSHLCSLPASTIGTIFAICRGRTSKGELHQLASAWPERLYIIRLDDVTDQAAVASAADEVERILNAKGGTAGLDVLINNAGIINRSQGNIETM